MAALYDETPEVAHQNYPEAVAYPPSRDGSPAYAYQQPHPQQQMPYAPKPESGYTPIDGSTYGGQTTGYGAPYAQPGPPASSAKTGSRCTTLLLLLSGIIVVLVAAVIGLAAGMGIETGRATDANNKLAALSASPTATVTTTVFPSATAAASSFNDLDNGCSDSPQTVNGTKYNAFTLLGGNTFTMFCNLDAPGSPLLSLFAADFNGCMDACSAYTKYAPGDFAGTGPNPNTTCAAVSFIPLWTARANASAGGAPGNCYLKPAPQNVSGLFAHDIGTEVHAAILSSG